MKTKQNSDFFVHEKKIVNEDFNSAEGFHEFDDEMSFDDDYSADATKGQQTYPTSDPFIFTLWNTTLAVINNVVCLDASNSIGQFNNGVTAGVTCTYNIPNIVYRQFLYKLVQSSYDIAEIYIDASLPAVAAQVLQIFYYDVQGGSATKSLFPKRDPYQQSATQIIHRWAFTLNGFTRFTIASLAAGATLQFSLYPSKEASMTQHLQGKPIRRYVAPGTTIAPLK